MGIRGECDQCNYTASNPVDLASSTSLLSPTDYALLTNINPWQINQAITLGPDEAVSSLTDADPLPPPPPSHLPLSLPPSPTLLPSIHIYTTSIQRNSIPVLFSIPRFGQTHTRRHSERDTPTFTIVITHSNGADISNES